MKVNVQGASKVIHELHLAASQEDGCCRKTLLIIQLNVSRVLACFMQVYNYAGESCRSFLRRL
jgi:hypothetical protein